MSVSLLNDLKAVQNFYEEANSEDYLQLALHTLIYSEDKKHKLYAEDYNKTEWKKIQTLKESAAKIPEICDSAMSTLVGRGDLPDDLDRNALRKACEALCHPEQNNFKAHRKLLEQSIRLLELWVLSQESAAEKKLSKQELSVLEFWNSCSAKPSYDDIVSALHMGKSTVTRVVNELRRRGFIPQE